MLVDICLFVCMYEWCERKRTIVFEVYVVVVLLLLLLSWQFIIVVWDWQVCVGCLG